MGRASGWWDVTCQRLALPTHSSGESWWCFGKLRLLILPLMPTNIRKHMEINLR